MSLFEGVSQQQIGVVLILCVLVGLAWLMYEE